MLDIELYRFVNKLKRYQIIIFNIFDNINCPSGCKVI